MSLSVQNNFVTRFFGTSAPPAAPSGSAPTAPGMPTDSVQLSNTPSQPMEAGFFKRMGDSFGEMFSDLADSMKFGDTFKLVEREFMQVDRNGDGLLNPGEFVLATMNPFDFSWADKNGDGQLTMSEYFKYRKTRLEDSFRQRDANADRFLNVTEIGAVGRWYLAQRDPRLDANQDGLVSKREYVRAQLTLGVSIRDMLGF